MGVAVSLGAAFELSAVRYQDERVRNWGCLQRYPRFVLLAKGCQDLVDQRVVAGKSAAVSLVICREKRATNPTVLPPSPQLDSTVLPAPLVLPLAGPCMVRLRCQIYIYVMALQCMQL